MNKKENKNNQLFLNHLNVLYLDIANGFGGNIESYNLLSDDEKNEILISIKRIVNNFETVISQTSFTTQNILDFTNNWWNPIIDTDIY